MFLMRSVSYIKIQKAFMLLALFCAGVFYSDAAVAQDNTLGDLVVGLSDGFLTLPSLLEMISRLLGAGFIIFGIYKFRDHVDRPSQVPMFDAIRMMIAGAFFLTLPDMVNYLIGTFGFQEIDAISNSGYNMSAGDNDGGLTVDGMLTSLANDLRPAMMYAFSVFSYMAGLIVFMIAIYRITRGFDQGPRGPLGMGTFAHFVTAAVLLSLPQALAVFSTTIFGSSDVKVIAVFSEDSGMTAELAERAHAIMMAVETFMIIIGIISFIRGWFILKSAADGNGQATTLSAFSHIVAGVVAVNIGPFINAVQQTFGLDPASGILFQ